MIRLEPRTPHLVTPTEPAITADAPATPTVPVTTDAVEDPDFPKWAPSPDDAPMEPVRTNRRYTRMVGHDPVHHHPDEVGPATIHTRPNRHSLVTEARITKGRHWLPEFDYYEFDPDGTPYRIRCAKVGKRPDLGPVKPLARHGRNGKGLAYSLRKTGGGRMSVSQTKLREMLAGTASISNRFTLREFPNNVFDDDGNVYSAKTGRPLSRYQLPHRFGWPVWGYRLWHGGFRKYVKISSHAVMRMRFGKCSMYSCEIPMGWRQPTRHGLLDDYCVDPAGTPYRIANRRQSTYEPQEIKPVGRAGNVFKLTKIDGTTGVYTRKQLREFCGYDDPPHEIEPFDPDSDDEDSGVVVVRDPNPDLEYR